MYFDVEDWGQGAEVEAVEEQLELQAVQPVADADGSQLSERHVRRLDRSGLENGR